MEPSRPKSELYVSRDYLDFRFDSLEKKIDHYCEEADALEERVRTLEWVGQVIAGIAAAVGIRTGFGE